MSLIHYKFKAAKDFASVTFDGLALSLFELKRDILLAKKLKGTDFDIIISNAQNNEDYTDDTQKIPKSTSVFVRRVPSKPGGTNAQFYLNEVTPADTNAKRIGDQNSAGYSFTGLNAFTQNEEYVPLSLDGVLPGRNEEDQVAALISQSSMQFQTQSYPGQAYPNNGQHNNGYNNGYNNKPTGKPHASYTCHRCGNKGHYVQNCPSQKDKRSFSPPKIKRTTGIPRAFLEKVDDIPEGRSAMITSDGSLVVSRPNNAAWERSRNNARGSAFAADELRETVVAPEKFKCSICEKLLNNAVSVPCCSTLFCQECITSALVDTEPELQFICPKCDQREVVPDGLRVENSVREGVEDFLKQIASGNVPTLVSPSGMINELFDIPAENNNGESGARGQHSSQRFDNNFDRPQNNYVDRRKNNSDNFQPRKFDNRNSNWKNNNNRPNHNNWNNNRNYSNNWNNGGDKDGGNGRSRGHSGESQNLNNEGITETTLADNDLFDDLGLDDQLPNQSLTREETIEDELLEKELETLPPLRWTSQSGITGHITIPPVEMLNGKSPFEVKGGDARRFQELLRNNRADGLNNDNFYEPNDRDLSHFGRNSNNKESRNNRNSSRSRSPVRRNRSRSPPTNVNRKSIYDDRNSRINRDNRDIKLVNNVDRHANSSRSVRDSNNSRSDKDSHNIRDGRSNARSDHDSRINRDDRYNSNSMDRDRNYTKKTSSSIRSRSRSRSPVRSRRRDSVDKVADRSRQNGSGRFSHKQHDNSHRDSSPRRGIVSTSTRDDKMHYNSRNNKENEEPHRQSSYSRNSNNRGSVGKDADEHLDNNDRSHSIQKHKKVEILKSLPNSRGGITKDEVDNKTKHSPARGSAHNVSINSIGATNNEVRDTDLQKSSSHSNQAKIKHVSINDRIGRPRNDGTKTSTDSQSNYTKNTGKNDRSNNSEKKPSILDRIGPINHSENNERRSKRNRSHRK